MSVYIIAEAGVNHNGQLDLALKLCDAAKEAGVDAVKFQTWKTENIVTAQARQAAYQTENTGVEESQYDMLKKLELSYDHFRYIQDYCKKIGIDFLSTPDEEESLAFLVRLGLPLIKVGSGEVTNIPYLRKIGSQKKPVILSTGMSNLAQVATAYDTLLAAGCGRWRRPCHGIPGRTTPGLEYHGDRPGAGGGPRRFHTERICGEPARRG